VRTDRRLAALRAVVFLGVKNKGGATPDAFTPLCTASYGQLIDHCLEQNIPFGFDSCSAPKFEACVKDKPDADALIRQSEDCESGLFSAYINAHGDFFPCSFSEGLWESGISVLEASDFLSDVWYHPRTIEFREKLIETAHKYGCRRCLFFPEINP
jgi:radical SAM protein with 4Fe4S-binding SPASM domain